MITVQMSMVRACLRFARKSFACARVIALQIIKKNSPRLFAFLTYFI